MKDSTNWHEVPIETIVCYCNTVTKKEIKDAIEAGATTLKEIQEKTKAGIGNNCKELNPKGRCCHSDLTTLINLYGNKETDSTSNNECCCNC